MERYEYTPYGILVPNVGASPNGVGYTGHVNDPETGLVYMQARYYDPAVGRFLSVDPVTAAESPTAAFNRYWYANNNPYRFIDPDGRDTTVQLRYYIIGSAPLQGAYGHQYVVLRDTDTGEAVVSRAGPSAEYPGGVSAVSAVAANSPVNDPNRSGKITLATISGPASQSADAAHRNGQGVLDSKDVSGSMVTLKEPIATAKITLGKFNNAVDVAHIDYKPRSSNSNAYAGTVYQVLTGKAAPGSQTLPGSNVNLKPTIPACATSDACGGHP